MNLPAIENVRIMRDSGIDVMAALHAAFTEAMHKLVL